MFHLNQEYSDCVDMSDKDNYPNGCAIDANTDEGVDGTPYTARWRNSIQGAMEALWYAAFGTHSGITKKPDTVFDSDVLRSVLRLIDTAFDKQWYQVEVKGKETVIPWSLFGRNYDARKNYSIVAVPAGNYEETLPIGATAADDGVHIFVRRLADGKIAEGTRMIKWGSFVFGERLFGESETMSINIIIKELAA